MSKHLRCSGKKPKRKIRDPDPEWGIDMAEDLDSSKYHSGKINTRHYFGSDSNRHSANNQNSIIFNGPMNPEGCRMVNLNDLTEPKICELCCKCFDNHLDFALHSIIHSEDLVFSCHLCTTVAVNEDVLKSHLKTHDRYQCSLCKRIIKKEETAQVHWRQHLPKPEPEVNCSYCGKQVKRVDMKNHFEEEHQGSTPGTIKCSVCTAEFSSRKQLKRHVATKHRECGVIITKLCEICGKEPADILALEEHMRTHTGEKPFVCSICSNRFRVAGALHKHMVSHSGESLYMCKICGKMYKSPSGYNYHMRRHAGVKPHCCIICGKAFTAKFTMETHVERCARKQEKLARKQEQLRTHCDS
ncbi:hypothetical protein JTB14_006904 [Gonioctena quinquepunctata]|nr:hypothetical protein JTB14_006904 [Gonioctena quinquepunctata]